MPRVSEHLNSGELRRIGEAGARRQPPFQRVRDQDQLCASEVRTLSHQNVGTAQSLLLQVGVVGPHRADRVGEICHEVGDNAVQQDER